MKPDEKLENLIRENGMGTRPEWLQQTKTEMLDTFQQTADSKAPAESIWRIIMKSSMTRMAAAAVILVAAWFIYSSTGHSGGVAWAA